MRVCSGVAVKMPISTGPCSWHYFATCAIVLVLIKYIRMRSFALEWRWSVANGLMNFQNCSVISRAGFGNCKFFCDGKGCFFCSILKENPPYLLECCMTLVCHLHYNYGVVIWSDGGPMQIGEVVSISVI